MGMKYFFLTILCLLSISAGAENLLSNPGFDRLKLDGTPAHWDLFIMPDNKAIGRADSITHDGYYSAMLHTPTPYSKDPINNWSQIVFDNLIGVPLKLSGSIRTENVGEAALWIQCFSKKRSRILATSSSTKGFMISGTQGWTSVSTQITPPSQTDFIVVRCIIKGQGQAWFDSLSLSMVEPEALEPPFEVLAAVESEPETLDPIDSNTHDILAVSQAMQQTIRDLEKSNQELLKKITEIQKDLDYYRKEIRAKSQVAPRPHGAHPLIPEDYIPQGDSTHE